MNDYSLITMVWESNLLNLKDHFKMKLLKVSVYDELNHNHQWKLKSCKLMYKSDNNIKYIELSDCIVDIPFKNRPFMKRHQFSEDPETHFLLKDFWILSATINGIGDHDDTDPLYLTKPTTLTGKCVMLLFVPIDQIEECTLEKHWFDNSSNNDELLQSFNRTVEIDYYQIPEFIDPEKIRINIYLEGESLPYHIKSILANISKQLKCSQIHNLTIKYTSICEPFPIKSLQDLYSPTKDCTNPPLPKQWPHKLNFECDTTVIQRQMPEILNSLPTHCSLTLPNPQFTKSLMNGLCPLVQFDLLA